jgi:predicted RNase H-like nuclease (RuvC/YqgF family)
MYPPHVTDTVVRAVIDELTVEDCLPSGALVRAVLKERYDSPGGVARIYRLLSGVRRRRMPVREVGDPEALERELKSLRERAERAEQREEAHQSRWAVEVDQLRLKVATYEPLVQQARTALESVGLLRRQLQSAEARIASLEQQLLEKQGRGADPR